MKKLLALLLFLIPATAYADLKGVIQNPAAVTTSGSFTSGHCVKFNNSGTTGGMISDTGAPCGASGGPFLPLSAGNGFPLSGDLYLNTGIKIDSVNGGGSNNYFQPDDGSLNLNIAGNNGSKIEIEAGGNISIVNNGATVTTTNTILDNGSGGGSFQTLTVNSNILSSQDGLPFIQYTTDLGIISNVAIGDIAGYYGGNLININSGSGLSDSNNTWNLNSATLNLGGIVPSIAGQINVLDASNNPLFNVDTSGDVTSAGFLSVLGGQAMLSSYFGNIFFTLAPTSGGSGGALNLQGYNGDYFQWQGGSSTSGSTGLTLYDWGNGPNIRTGTIAFRCFGISGGGRVRIGTMAQSAGDPGVNAGDDGVNGVQIVGGLGMYAQNLNTDTTTGMVLWNSSTQKGSFWGASPAIQSANSTPIDTLLANTGLRASGGTANFATAISTAAAQTSVNCSTSGTVVFSEPEQGSSKKEVLAYAAACLGTASYTYPTAFSHTPYIPTTNSLGAAAATSLSTSAVTITGTTSTGFLSFEGF